MKIFKILIATIVIFTAFCIPVQVYSADDLSGGIIDKRVNSDHEDYGAYLIYGKDTDTLFFTSSRPVKNRRPIALPAEIFLLPVHQELDIKPFYKFVSSTFYTSLTNFKPG